MFTLLCLQVFDFVADVKRFAFQGNAAITAFASLQSFIQNHVAYATVPLIILPLTLFIIWGPKSKSIRRYLDAIGIYIVARMFVQLIGLNLLLFDAVTPGATLITQLLLFLPYSLLVWGWIYWRLDEHAATNTHRYFRLDCERETPRPVDYLIASFSSVFSASISAIKGRSAKAKLLIIIHGFFVYDLMGLMLSRAVSLVQGK